LLCGVTGVPLGKSARSFALSFSALVPCEPALATGPGFGVAGTLIGRAGPGFDCPAFPGWGPGEPKPFGPGLGAVPAAFARAAPLVGLGDGTPGFADGDADATGPGAGEALGAAVDFVAATSAVGAAVGAAGTGVAGFCVGAAVGAGGFGVGCAVGDALGTGLGAAVGGGLTTTATAVTDGKLVGSAGSWFSGLGS
jgi:hypothetical protein